MKQVDKQDRVNLNYLLTHRNINGEIYDIDIDRWLGFYLEDSQRQDIKKQLMEVIKHGKT